ncbi:MAG: FAD-binding protein [Gemmatimonadales bacterium]|nr:MAG: FAD-binding protein [Gemmatimonadales bacterium]
MAASSVRQLAKRFRKGSMGGPGPRGGGRSRSHPQVRCAAGTPERPPTPSGGPFRRRPTTDPPPEPPHPLQGYAMPMKTPLRALVIGAGMAGLTAARILEDHGLSARILDKGRVPGGRISTRTSSEGWSMDHGAPFFTARDPAFRRQVEAWAAAGIAAPWTGRIGYLPRHGDVEPASEATRWVGVPGMRAVPLRMARALDVRTGVEVAPLVGPAAGGEASAGSGRWVVAGDAYDLVLVTAPPAQASVLLGAAHPGFAATLAGVGMRPCWALMLRIRRRGGRPGILPWDALFLKDHPVFRWVARDSSKPGRDEDGRAGDPVESWVLHAAPGWSEHHLEHEDIRVAGTLAAEFMALVGRLGGKAGGPAVDLLVETARAHRWRYAAPEDAAAPGEPAHPGRCLWDAAAGIGVAGDALGGGRVEGAFLSGAALAREVLVSTGAGSPPR